MRRIAVIGASGLAGAALCEHLIDAGRDEVVPLIRSSGNAWRLARRGLELRSVNCLDAADISNAIRGCTHVVNCVRGDDATMHTGLRKLIEASRKQGVKGFVHLSSVAVYGDPPPPEASSEDARVPPPPKGTYGRVKYLQDQVVSAAAHRGLQSVILCPPNISGPYSYFINGVLDALYSDRLALVDQGAAPCNLVDTRNLAHAIDLALDHCTSEARRFFVTDDEPITWADVVKHLLRFAASSVGFAELSRTKAEEIVRSASRPTRRSIGRSLLHLASSDVRSALRRDAFWAKVDSLLRRGVAAMGADVEGALRLSIEGPLSVAKIGRESSYAVPLLSQQLRTVRHSCESAKRSFGYAPLVSFDQSMAAFGACLAGESWTNSEWQDLLSLLSDPLYSH